MTHSVLWVSPVVGDRVVGIVVFSCPCAGQSTVPLIYQLVRGLGPISKQEYVRIWDRGVAQRAWASASCPTIDSIDEALLRLHQAVPALPLLVPAAGFCDTLSPCSGT